jgi:hypothetical protein
MASTAIFINAIAPGKTKGKGEARSGRGPYFAFLECAWLDLLDGHDFPAVVGAAGHAGMVRLLDLLALRAEREAGRLEVLVGAPLVPAGL